MTDNEKRAVIRRAADQNRAALDRLADQREEWTAVAWSRGEKVETPHDSLAGALDFLWDGYCDATLSPDHVIGPDGKVAVDRDGLREDRLARMDAQDGGNT